jgi:hypothetical protein
LQVRERLRERHVPITVPVAVVGEWWRGLESLDRAHGSR